MKSNSSDKVIMNSHLKDLNPLFVGSEKCESGHSYGPNVRKYTLIHYVVAGKGIVYKKGEALQRIISRKNTRKNKRKTHFRNTQRRGTPKVLTDSGGSSFLESYFTYSLITASIFPRTSSESSVVSISLYSS